MADARFPQEAPPLPEPTASGQRAQALTLLVALLPEPLKGASVRELASSRRAQALVMLIALLLASILAGVRSLPLLPRGGQLRMSLGRLAGGSSSAWGDAPPPLHERCVAMIAEARDLPSAARTLSQLRGRGEWAGEVVLLPAADVSQAARLALGESFPPLSIAAVPAVNLSALSAWRAAHPFRTTGGLESTPSAVHGWQRLHLFAPWMAALCGRVLLLEAGTYVLAPLAPLWAGLEPLLASSAGEGRLVAHSAAYMSSWRLRLGSLFEREVCPACWRELNASLDLSAEHFEVGFMMWEPRGLTGPGTLPELTALAARLPLSRANEQGILNVWAALRGAWAPLPMDCQPLCLYDALPRHFREFPRQYITLRRLPAGYAGPLAAPQRERFSAALRAALAGAGERGAEARGTPAPTLRPLSVAGACPTGAARAPLWLVQAEAGAGPALSAGALAQWAAACGLNTTLWAPRGLHSAAALWEGELRRLGAEGGALPEGARPGARLALRAYSPRALVEALTAARGPRAAPTLLFLSLADVPLAAGRGGAGAGGAPGAAGAGCPRLAPWLARALPLGTRILALLRSRAQLAAACAPCADGGACISNALEGGLLRAGGGAPLTLLPLHPALGRRAMLPVWALGARGPRGAPPPQRTAPAAGALREAALRAGGGGPSPLVRAHAGSWIAPPPWLRLEDRRLTLCFLGRDTFDDARLDQAELGAFMRFHSRFALAFAPLQESDAGGLDVGGLEGASWADAVSAGGGTPRELAVSSPEALGGRPRGAREDALVAAAERSPALGLIARQRRRPARWQLRGSRQQEAKPLTDWAARCAFLAALPREGAAAEAALHDVVALSLSLRTPLLTSRTLLAAHGLAGAGALVVADWAEAGRALDALTAAEYDGLLEALELERFEAVQSTFNTLGLAFQGVT